MPADWPPALAPTKVQVWSINLLEATLPEAEYQQTLTVDELERAGRLRAGQVRMQFVVGRACLRRLLGAALEIASEKVSIVAGRFGKPELDGEHRGKIHFNVAHARSTILVALSLAGPVGIDVEYLDRDTDVLGVARHSLTDRETAALLAIDDLQGRSRAFFECWTRKEAVVKADGRGLSLPLTSFEVPVAETCRSSPIQIHNAAEDTYTHYFLTDIALSDDTACALAVSNRLHGLDVASFPLL